MQIVFILIIGIFKLIYVELFDHIFLCRYIVNAI